MKHSKKQGAPLNRTHPTRSPLKVPNIFAASAIPTQSAGHPERNSIMHFLPRPLSPHPMAMGLVQVVLFA